MNIHFIAILFSFAPQKQLIARKFGNFHILTYLCSYERNEVERN